MQFSSVLRVAKYFLLLDPESDTNCNQGRNILKVNSKVFCNVPGLNWLTCICANLEKRYNLF